MFLIRVWIGTVKIGTNHPSGTTGFIKNMSGFIIYPR